MANYERLKTPLAAGGDAGRRPIAQWRRPLHRSDGRVGRQSVHPLQWLSQRDAGLSALRRAGRAAIVLPGVFALGEEVIGDPTLALFGAFGSFAMLFLVDFPEEAEYGTAELWARDGLFGFTRLEDGALVLRIESRSDGDAERRRRGHLPARTAWRRGRRARGSFSSPHDSSSRLDARRWWCLTYC